MPRHNGNSDESMVKMLNQKNDFKGELASVAPRSIASVANWFFRALCRWKALELRPWAGRSLFHFHPPSGLTTGHFFFYALGGNYLRNEIYV